MCHKNLKWFKVKSCIIKKNINHSKCLIYSKELTKLKSKNPSIDFSYFIMICKLYKMKQSKKNKNSQNEQVIWSNAEEELFDDVGI